MPRRPAHPVSLDIRLLGPFHVAVGGRPLPRKRLSGRNAAALVKLLALQPHHQLHREEIQDLLWPEADPDRAVNNLSKVIHHTRHAFEPELAQGAKSRFVVTGDQQVVLCAPGELRIDVEAFEREAAAATRDRDVEAGERALALYEGDLLVEDPYEDWWVARREHLRARRRDVLGLLARLYEERGEPERSVIALDRLFAADPLDEEALRRLMTACARAGAPSQALDRYRQGAAALRRELDAEPESETVALFEQIRSGEVSAPRVAPALSTARMAPPAAPEPVATPASERTNVPRPTTSFVGRERDVDSLAGLIASSTLVTLTGPGGIGKTRLAIELVSRPSAGSPRAACFVDLAALTDPGLVTKAIASALGVTEEKGRPLLETLADAIGRWRGVLVLDNCEHVLASTASVVDALAKLCPGLRVLATCREPLGVRFETVWPVPPMELPGEDADASLALDTEAVRLFVKRARQHDPRFALEADRAALAAAVCRRLDGLPLAIELAAARVTVLSLEQLVARIENRFHLLKSTDRDVPARHRTLRAMMDWSYSLLLETERMMLRRLAVFAGGWTLEAAEEICSGRGIDRDAALDLLTRLVDKSLVATEATGGEIRFRMLETVRQYAREKLDRSGETAYVHTRHRDWYLALAEEAEAELVGADQGSWFARLGVERDNIRVALEWTKTSAAAAHEFLRLAAAMRRYWYLQGHSREGLEWLEAALAADPSAPEPLRAKALYGAGLMAGWLGDYGHAVALLEESVQLYRAAGDSNGIAGALNQLGAVAFWTGEFDRSEALRRESLEVAREAGDEASVAIALNNLGLLASRRGDAERAAALHTESLGVFRRLGNDAEAARALNNLGILAAERDDTERATALFEESLAINRDLANEAEVATTLGNLGLVAEVRGEYERAESLLEESLAVARAIGARRDVAHTLQNLGRVVRRRDDVERAAGMLRESVTLSSALGDRPLQGAALRALGSASVDQGRYETARSLFADAVAVARETRETADFAEILDGCASLAAAIGKPAKALRLTGAAQHLREAARIPQSPENLADLERRIEPARRALGAAESEREIARGWAMALAEAVDYALDVEGVERSVR